MAISLHFILLLGLTMMASPQFTSIFAFMAKWVYLSLRDHDVVFYAIWPAGHISRAVCWAALLPIPAGHISGAVCWAALLAIPAGHIHGLLSYD